ncbi:MAG: hypothetical protein JJU33_06405 [Phycisphaerales bacterium]|nr:hypothetical protein [Phycisphaerales bacterium]
MKHVVASMSVAMVLMAVSPAFADENPYQELWKQYSEPMATVLEAFPPSGPFMDLSWRPEDPALLEAIETPGMLDAIVAASKSNRSGWLEGDGPESYGSILVGVASALVTDNRSAMLAGDSDRSVERVLALWRCAMQHRAERSLDEGALCVWLVWAAANETRALAEGVELSDQQIGRILEALKWTEKTDPFGYRAALEHEPKAMIARLHDERDAAIAAQKEVLEQRRAVVEQNGFIDKRDEQEARRDVDSRIAALSRWIADSYRDAERLWDHPDAKAKLDELDLEIEHSEFFRLIMLPSYEASWQFEQSGLKHAELARTALTEARTD